jgi:hypothetical protein
MASVDASATGNELDGAHDLGHSRKQIMLNAFDMFTPTHMNFGQWKVRDDAKYVL